LRVTATDIWSIPVHFCLLTAFSEIKDQLISVC
jgi:hypothetical protein